MLEAQTTPLAITATILSPLGEVRVWIDPAADDAAHAVRTSIRLDFCGGQADGHLGYEVQQVADQLASAVRSLTVGQDTVLTARPSFGPWLADRVESHGGARTLIRDLYRDYVTWCDLQALAPIGEKAFGDSLTRRGFVPAGKSPHGRYRGGLRLRFTGPRALDAAPAAADAAGARP